MSITNNANIDQSIESCIYVREAFVNQIVQAAIVDRARATDNMVIDFPELYNDKQSIEAGYSHLRLHANDFLRDAMETLQKQVNKRLAEIEFTARVRKMEFDEAGNVTDAEVNINFE
jgi:hypothetical protein